MGFLSKQYESSGAGISKKAPKKKGFKLFGEIFIRKFWKLIEANMLYSIFFIPLVLAWICFVSNIFSTNAALISGSICVLIFMILIGPATAGLTRVMRKYTLEKHSFIFSDFKKTFKNNFKQSAIIGFVDCIAIVSIVSGLYIYPRIASMYGSIMYFMMAIVLSVGITILIMNFYIFPMIIATDLSLKNIIKNSFALACVALKKNVITLLITLAIYGLTALMLLLNINFLFVLPFFPAAFVHFIICFNSYPIIQKYVINPYYESKGEVNPELENASSENEDDAIFEDKGGSEKPIESRKKGKGKIIS